MFRELEENEIMKIEGGKGTLKGWVIGKVIDATIGAAVKYAKNPHPVGAGCSAVE